MLFVLLIIIAILSSCTPEEISIDNKAILNQAITDTKNLIRNSSFGNGEGQYTIKALTKLNTTLKKAESVHKSDYSTEDEFINATSKLYDDCMTFETNYFTSLHDALVDSIATREYLMKYLYNAIIRSAGIINYPHLN